MISDLSDLFAGCGLTMRALARAFTPPPDIEIWEWSDATVLLQNEDAAEPGEYRSSKTPWTRRLQEIIRNPMMWVWSWKDNTYVRVSVTEFNIQKSSQSGFTEACLNGIRWRAVFKPGNVIYAIDSAEEAKKIAARLLRSFAFLDSSIFTGDEDDIKSLFFKLRGMDLLFYGSFSSGKFANKFGVLNVADEVEEHGKQILDDMLSRKKTTTGGLQINLSKPKLKGGPINRAFERGNQEEFFVPCPHCGQFQYFTFFPTERDVSFHEFHGLDDLIAMTDDKGKVTYLPKPLPLGETRKLSTGRFAFDFCKNLLGQWDRLRVQTETHYECVACKGVIENGSKRWLIDRGIWLPMELAGEPGIVSQQMSDFYSEDLLSSFGRIAGEYIAASHESHDKLRNFWNHRAGRVWSEEANATEPADIVANMAGRKLWFVDGPNSEGQIVRNVFTDEPSAVRLANTNAGRGVDSPVIHSACQPYKRGSIPFVPFKMSKDAPGLMILGSDVGGNYAKWVAVAIAQNLLDIAVTDWGEELDPDSIRHVIQTHLWPVPLTGEKCRVHNGWIDARWRGRDVYIACLASKGQMIPCQGIGGQAAKNIKLWSYAHLPMYPERFKQLAFNDQRAKDAVYIDRIKKKRKRVWFPVDVEEDPQFISELCAEKQKKDKAGNYFWPDDATGNHYGDCLKLAILGLDFLTRNLDLRAKPV